jgi:hypothetical protein
VSAAGLFLIGVPLAFNAAFAVLAARFAWSLWLIATGVVLL